MFDNKSAMSCLCHLYANLWCIGLSRCHKKDISNNVIFALKMS